ncbi:MAG: lamin tail domain-containing protein [Deltaproteobacteria bacterium]|nr:lamin tail domain-containing protein [Deltaproteobacteria bacterium]
MQPIRALLVASLALTYLLPALAAKPADGVVISEVFYNDSNDNEWIELHNPTASAVVIDGWTIDDGDNEGMLKIVSTHLGPNFGIMPGGSVVLAQRASTFAANHCFQPDFAMIVGASTAAGLEPQTTQAFLLSNTDDQVILRDGTGTVVDAVGWGCQKSSSSSPCGTDSNALQTPLLSTSAAFKSAIRTDPAQEGDEPAGEVSEVLPLDVADAHDGTSSGGLWTHVRTATFTAGVSNCDPDISLYAHAGPTTGGLIRFPYISALTVSSAAAGTGGVELIVQGEAFEPGATVSFGGTGILVRQSQWVSSEAIRVVIDLRPSATPGARDVTVSQPSGYGDTVAAAFTVTAHAIVPATEVVISELLPAPTGGGTAGEWLELFNPTGTFVSLDGWTLSDGTATLTLPDPVAGQPDLIFVPAASVVLARDADLFRSTHGVDPDFAIAPGATTAWPVVESAGSFELLDSGGRVYLRDEVGLLVDAVAWGSQPPASDLTHALPYAPATGESVYRVERADQGDEQGGALNERFVEAFETSDRLPTAQVSDLGEGPETGGLQAIPILTSVSPPSAEQGTTGVTLTIDGRNFAPTATVTITDAGITYWSTTVISENQIEVVIDIDPTAPVSLRDVRVTNPGGYQGTLPGGFRVTLPLPLLTVVSPASVFQGDTSVVLDLTGVNTHFTAGDSQVLLGDGTGYAIEAISVTSLTSLQVTVTFLLNATPGLWDVRVSTAAFSESAVGTGLLEVRPLPRVEAVNPATGNQGQTLGVTLSGLYTDFLAAAPSVDFGPDITVSNVSALGATTLTATLDIGPFATLGPRGVTVTTGAEVAPSAAPVFEVLPRPAIVTVTPATAFQGDTLYVTLEGINTSWLAGISTASFGAGVTVRSLTVNGPASAVAQIAIDPAASPGSRDVAVTTGTELAGLPSAFEVVGRPRVTGITPASVQQGASGLSLALTGEYTSWDATTTVSFSDLGLSVSNVSVTSPTSLTLTLDVAGNAPLGLRDVLCTTGSEVALATGGLRVTALAYISAVSPPRATQGQSLTLEVMGANTAFTGGVSTLDLGPGIAVSNLSVTSPSRLTADLVVDPAAALGSRDVVVDTGGTVAVGTALFTVDPLPYVSSVSPGSGVQGTRLSVDLGGVNTSFDAGSFASFGTGVAVVGQSAAGPTALTVELAIAIDAPPGVRDVTVFTGTEIAAGAGLFEVIQAPEIISVTPDAAATGDVLDVAVVGLATHFAPGITAVDFGPGIGVTTVTVTSATVLTASIAVSGKAAPGLRDVTVTTGGEQAIALDAFTVLLQPRLRRITPASGVQGDLVIIEVEGQGTSFVEGDVTLDLGAGANVSNLSVAGTLRFVAEVNLDLDAPPGLRDVVVTTGGQTLTLADGFTVNALSRVASVSPASARREDVVDVTLTGVNTSWGSGSGAVFGDGITVSNVACPAATTCTATLTIEPLARLGLRDVTVITQGQTAQGFGLFDVLPKAQIDAIFPDHAVQGEGLVVTVVISGALIAGTSDALDFGPGITVGGLQLAADLRSITANLIVDLTAAAGPRDVIVRTSDAGDLVAADGFRVEGRASILTATPASIPQGETVEVTLLGDRTSFDADLSIVDFGEGTAIAELTVVSAEELRARVRASPLAELGPRDVTVTTGTEIAIGLGLVNIVEAGTPIDGDPNAGEGGCSCSSPAGTTPGGALGLLFLLGLALFGRRRR